ncbi:MAG: hypothetical protein V1857_05150 [archaeon]
MEKGRRGTQLQFEIQIIQMTVIKEMTFYVETLTRQRLMRLQFNGYDKCRICGCILQLGDKASISRSSHTGKSRAHKPMCERCAKEAKLV